MKCVVSWMLFAIGRSFAIIKKSNVLYLCNLIKKHINNIIITNANAVFDIIDY